MQKLESKMFSLIEKTDLKNVSAKEFIFRMKDDLETLKSKVNIDKEGNKLNPLKLDKLDSFDVKTLAAKLKQIDETTNTHGEYYKIGELCGFKLLVKTEESMKEGMFAKENRFFVEGDGCVKYTYNNGRIANEPKLAVQYFLHALEKIPSLIEEYEKKTEKISTDLPVLQEIATSSWKKENELKELKNELFALDRKIQLSLKPIDQSEDKTEKLENKPNTKVFKL